MVICGGDCNVRLHHTLDTSKPYYSGEKKPTKCMKLTIKELRLSDVWRDLNPKKSDYTHPHIVYLRLDYFFTFLRDLYGMIEWEMGSVDLYHSPIVMDFF